MALGYEEVKFKKHKEIEEVKKLTKQFIENDDLDLLKALDEANEWIRSNKGQITDIAIVYSTTLDENKRYRRCINVSYNKK